MGMFQSIRAKMLLAFAISSLAVAGVAWQGVSSLGTVGHHLEEATTDVIPSIMAMAELQDAINAVRTQTRAALIGAMEKDQERYRNAVTAKNAAWVRVDKSKADFEKLPMSDAGKKVWAELNTHLPAYRAANDQVFAHFEAGEVDKGDDLLKGHANAVVKQLAEKVDEIVALNAAQAERLSKAATADSASATRNMVIFGVLAALGSIALGFVLTQMITKPLSQVSDAAAAIANGDLDQEITHRGTDEIGVLADSFRNLLDYVKGIAGAADAMSRGDLSVKVTPKSEADVLSKNFVKNTDAVKALVAEMNMLITAAQNGALSTRADARKFQGSYAELVTGVNQLIESIMQPINEAAAVLERVADRDLTARVKGEYKGDHAKIKVSLNQAVENLHDGLSSVSIAVEQVASAAQQIASSSQSVAQGASEQARSIEETSSRLTEMSTMTQTNAKSASSANDLASTAKSTSDQGAQAMAQMSEAMVKIRAAAEGTAAIIRDINEISFQTNLLALNAAVEAARAGAAGRGFAVVAEEVRNLALRSKEAAKKTESLINDSVQLAQNGESVSKQVSENLNQIIGLAGKVSDIIGEIAQASQEQAKGIDVVNASVGKMDRVTQQNAASSEESSSAAQELSGQAQEMTVLVGQFKLDRRGNPVTPSAKAKAVGKSAKGLPAPAKNGAPKNGGAGKQAIPFDEDPVFSDF